MSGKNESTEITLENPKLADVLRQLKEALGEEDLGYDAQRKVEILMRKLDVDSVVAHRAQMNRESEAKIPMWGQAEVREKERLDLYRADIGSLTEHRKRMEALHERSVIANEKRAVETEQVARGLFAIASALREKQ